MNRSEPNIYYIAGLGADLRLFNDLHKVLPGRSVLWPHELGDSMPELAVRLIEINNLTPGDIVIGFSFGGQLAKEIKARHPEINAIAISSIKYSHELAFSFKILSFIMRFIPNFLLRKMLLSIGKAHATKNSKGLKETHHKLLEEMAQDLNMSFFKKTLKLCSNWKNTDDQDIYYINGENDTVIPYQKSSVNCLIPDAGHLITYTHPQKLGQEIIQYVESRNNEL